ncbi:hypothetical protein L5G28_12590 [Gordonia sp. HY285]|uniref:hypothetical protein n=1 Tax=Gordonia liuliyuniae TaxID=2911517 RepID=UPI001F2AC8CA|nr:hypothetical protein [Gordonia liuliyuniae]MCF8610986.1 hypothetical protein [Gordonia liuliyuniae]
MTLHRRPGFISTALAAVLITIVCTSWAVTGQPVKAAVVVALWLAFAAAWFVRSKPRPAPRHAAN